MSLSKIKQTFLTAALLAMPILAQDDGSGAGESGGASQGGGLFGGNFMFIMIAMFAIIYFVMIRPEQKKQKERQKMLSALKKGDKIVSIGGIVGTVTAVRDSSYLVKTGEGSVIEITKSAIGSLVNDAKDGGEVKVLEDQVKVTSDGKESR